MVDLKKELIAQEMVSDNERQGETGFSKSTKSQSLKKQEAPEGKDKPWDKMTKEEVIERVTSSEKTSETYYELYLRSQAEMENIKRRTQKEKEEWYKYATEALIKELLQVLDNLELAIVHSNTENSNTALREGVELTLKGLRDILLRSGLEEVQAIGSPFDPNYHQAVCEEVKEEVEAGIVVRVLQKGYRLNNRLLRPAMVTVSRGKAGENNNESICHGR